MVSIPGKIVSQQFAYGCLFQIHKISKNTTRGKCKCWTLSISVSTGLQFNQYHGRAALGHHLYTLPGGLGCSARKPRDLPEQGSGSHPSNHTHKDMKAWVPGSSYLEQGLESQKNKYLTVSSNQNSQKEHRRFKTRKQWGKKSAFLEKQKALEKHNKWITTLHLIPATVWSWHRTVE